ncbi:MAG: glutathione peroxidase [Leptospiraceae bacterium]|nr:glutathione peroxidase [Leptospiraceae bacterium]
MIVFFWVNFSQCSQPVHSSEIYSLSTTGIKGETIHFDSYKGKVLLIVNVASQCGYTGQYKNLEAVYRKYKDKGFVVLGFPSNDFGEQEPGSDKEIVDFCKLNYGVSFPLMSKSHVRGALKNPIYHYLLKNSSSKNEIKWNFEKFLVNKKGIPVERFSSSILPDSTEIESMIETLLKE